MPPRFIIEDAGTIRETRDDPNSPSRPRKRARVDSVADGGGYEYTGTERPTEPCGPVHDDPVYFSNDADAECVVRVGNTRFKVKGDLLADVSILFKDMLLRQRRLKRQPDGSMYPLVLVSITLPEEFRALMWALNASEKELLAQPIEHDEIDRLLSISSISYQFDCPKLKTWANAALLRTFSAETSLLSSCSSALLTRALDVAIRTRQDDLIEATITRWCERLKTGDTPCVPAIIAADIHELQGLRGVAYYQHVQSMIARQTTVTGRGATQFTADARLSNAQVMRLLSGHWSLVSLWERTRKSAVNFACECSGVKSLCADLWVQRWKCAVTSDRVNALSSGSILRLIALVGDILAADQRLKEEMSPGCRRNALAAVKTRAEEIEEGIADHFFGWL
ncbi:unnamed protein product [Mycena citricolor]|uniref:BTB domain-containing protein n=1 Tax=Mycena citricolor TaxID=2018698 RepID=A0AAD2I0M7_9AGAR|nr:unnamed protein product [Mycena citricolor]CAK5283877.1 unnamed protein product [Mycena citricolor]